MTAGIRIRGSSGIIQIDGVGTNFNFKQKLVMSINTFDVSGGAAQFSFTGKTPMVFFQCAAFVWLVGITVSGATHTYTYCADRPATITFFIFDKVDNVRSAYGLRIMDETTGEVAFDALTCGKLLKIITMLPTANGIMNPTPLGYSNIWLNSAICLTQARVDIAHVSPPPPGGGCYLKFEGAACDPSIIAFGGVPTLFIDFGSDRSLQSSGGDIMVIDATGL